MRRPLRRRAAVPVLTGALAIVAFVTLTAPVRPLEARGPRDAHLAEAELERGRRVVREAAVPVALGVLVAANLAATMLRFVLLRAWVFRPVPAASRRRPRARCV